MILTKDNLYLQEHGKDYYVICIELPDKSRNYIHSQGFILGTCLDIIDELIGFDLRDANIPYLEKDGTYYRVKMTIETKDFGFNDELYFHSRKLNLNDAVRERQMLIEEEQKDGDVIRQ